MAPKRLREGPQDRRPTAATIVDVEGERKGRGPEIGCERSERPLPSRSASATFAPAAKEVPGDRAADAAGGAGEKAVRPPAAGRVNAGGLGRNRAGVAAP